MALGRAHVQQGFDDPRALLGDRLREGSLYRLLADHGQTMFPDGYFADLYTGSVKGRPTVAARVVATVMLLQAFEGLSDREACDRLEVDLRWQAAAGVDAGYRAFHPTVLVGMRNKLRASDRPRRLFEDTKVAARAAGAIKGRARVLDSTAVYDAVATQDTVTQLRAAIRKVLAALGAAGSPLAGQVRAVLRRDDDYATRVSRRATGTTRLPARRLSMSWSPMRWPRWVPSMGGRFRCPLATRLTCWRWWPGRTWSRVRTGCSGSPAKPPLTG